MKFLQSFSPFVKGKVREGFWVGLNLFLAAGLRLKAWYGFSVALAGLIFGVGLGIMRGSTEAGDDLNAAHRAAYPDHLAVVPGSFNNRPVITEMAYHNNTRFINGYLLMVHKTGKIQVYDS